MDDSISDCAEANHSKCRFQFGMLDKENWQNFLKPADEE